MRPMLPFFGFPTYHLSKYLTTVLQPLTDKSPRKLKSTENFIDDNKLVSFDTKSLFPVFHFDWLYRVLRAPSNGLSLNCRYLLKTSWNYWTFDLDLLSGQLMVNTTSSCMLQLWSPLFLLWRALATCRQTLRWPATPLPPHTKTKLTLFTNTLINEQNADVQFTKRDWSKWKSSFSWLLGEPRQQRATNGSYSPTALHHPCSPQHTITRSPVISAKGAKGNLNNFVSPFNRRVINWKLAMIFSPPTLE